MGRSWFNDPESQKYSPPTITTSDDPAWFLLADSHTTTPVEGVYRPQCYVCRDPEFAMMGLPLCKPCPACQQGGSMGHIPADDVECTDCGETDPDYIAAMDAMNRGE